MKKISYVRGEMRAANLALIIGRQMSIHASSMSIFPRRYNKKDHIHLDMAL